MRIQPRQSALAGDAAVLTRAGLIFAMAAATWGCAALTKNSKSEVASGAKVHIKQDHMSADDLEVANRAFADRYVMRLSTACDLVTEGNTNEVQRSRGTCAWRCDGDV